MHNRKTIWIMGGFLLMVMLLTGSVVGSVAAYLLTASPEAAVAPGAVEAVRVEPVRAVEAPALQTGPLVVDESDTVEAVETVLPAVVTVLSRGSRGGGSGSGFFVDEAGHVVTNYHVIEGSQDLIVIYAQGGSAPARLVGTAPDFDLALLRVDGPIPAVATWGDSSALPLGAGVVAIGSALGQYQNTVTSGILSGFNRELGNLRGLLQTDAAINSGNSGGPLINLGGQVVGINTMVVRGGFSGSAEGLGFAIPSNVARTVAQRLINGGDAKPAFLGIQYQPLNPQVVSEQGLTISEGALLSDIVAGTPAQRAGLQTGDIIMAINGRPVDERNPLVSRLLEHVAGETITLEVMRNNGQVLQLSLTLGERA